MKILIGAIVVIATIAMLASSRVVSDGCQLILAGDRASGMAMLEEWATQWKTSSLIALGDRYARKGPVKYDEAEAGRWYRRAAESGSPVGQTEMGRAYEGGLDVPLDYAMAMKWYRKAADQKYGPASLRVGWLYQSGKGVPTSVNDAFIWFQKAGDQGNAIGQLNAGLAYLQGQGIEKDNVRAAAWFRKAADQGLPEGELMLATMYKSGWGVPQDLAKAREWMGKAAAHGNAMAEFNVGAMYLNGEGVPKNEDKAYDAFLKAARQGNGGAMDALGQLYRAPLFANIAQDITAAYAYFNLAAAADDEQGKIDKANLEPGLTPGQIASGQALASQWKTGGSLPLVTTLEDLAPQYAFADGATAKEWASTRVWFSRDFTASGIAYRTVFLVTKGSECHVCTARVSAVTLKTQPSSDRFRWRLAQRYFGELGSYGDVEDSMETASAPNAPDRIKSRDVEIDGTRRMILIDSSEVGSGTESQFLYVFAFDSKNGWYYAGAIATGESGGEEVCRTASPGVTQASKDRLPLCYYRWSGTVQVEKQPSGLGWPDLIVKVSGTDFDPESQTLHAAHDLHYSFDGRTLTARRAYEGSSQNSEFKVR